MKSAISFKNFTSVQTSIIIEVKKNFVRSFVDEPILFSCIFMRIFRV